MWLTIFANLHTLGWNWNLFKIQFKIEKKCIFKKLIMIYDKE